MKKIFIHGSGHRAIDKIIWNLLLIRKVVNTTNFYNNNNINFK